MRYHGSLGDLKATMHDVATSLGHVNEIGQTVNSFLNRRRGMSGLGASGSDDAADAISDTLSQDPSGQQVYIVSSTVTPNGPNAGYTVIKYSDGSAKILNTQGQDVTGNFTNSYTPPSAWQNATSSIGDAVSNAPATVASGVANAVSTTAGAVVKGVASNIPLMIGLGVVAYFLYESHKGK
jgi:hypothetical protein